MFSSVTSAWAPAPAIVAQWSSTHPILSGGSSNREAMSTGRRPTWRLRSAMRAERFAERTAVYVAAARTSVPPAVASDEIVVRTEIGGIVIQSTTGLFERALDTLRAQFVRLDQLTNRIVNRALRRRQADLPLGPPRLVSRDAA